MGAHRISFRIFADSIPIGILIALVLFINEFPDYVGDKAVGKRTWVVMLGKKNAIALYHVLVALTYIIIIGLTVIGFLPYACLIALLSLPIALKAYSVAKNNYEKVGELLPANAATIALHSIIGILLCGGIVIDKVFMLWK